MTKYTELRHALHRLPELAGGERGTSETVLSYLEHCDPDRVVTGIGGFGIAAVFDGDRTGSRIMVRCELDALPIHETTSLPYRSEIAGVSHKCGHDGHMTILAGLAERLHARRPDAGSVVLLFQPSEETGEGAARVLADPAFSVIQPDWILALHNLPGYPLGQVIIREHVFASASSGLHIHLSGKTSHAAEPEAGNSPALAVAQLIQVLSTIPQFHTPLHEPAQMTVVHVRVGEAAFGTSPGEGDVMVTLRAHSQAVIDRLADRAVAIARGTADMFGLEMTALPAEPFPPTVNDSAVVTLIEKTAQKAGLSVHRQEQPFAWSEDFGHFTASCRGALFGLGAGENHPALHHPDYDFPDGLIPVGIALFESVIRELLVGDGV